MSALLARNLEDDGVDSEFYGTLSVIGALRAADAERPADRTGAVDDGLGPRSPARRRRLTCVASRSSDGRSVTGAGNWIETKGRACGGPDPVTSGAISRGASCLEPRDVWPGGA